MEKEEKNISRRVVLKFFETTDVHGNFIGYDFINNHSYQGGLCKVDTYVRRQRKLWGKEHCVLMDGGDILEGQPCAYYANFVDKSPCHLAADVMNFMEYDAATFGNHDFEVGHEVYDKWISNVNFPVLGANIVRDDNRQPYVKPYTVLERDGIRIAVLGLITPAIPMWLPRMFWSGVHFGDIVESAHHWVEKIKDEEHPDVMIGLFHTGLKEEGLNGFNENAAEEIATDVPGFDVIFFGHDHRPCAQEVENKVDGRKVLVLNAGGATLHVAEAQLVCFVSDQGVKVEHKCGQLVSVVDYPVDLAFAKRYAGFKKEVKHYVSQKIGKLVTPINAADYFFGPSALGDLLHMVQLKDRDADISLSAPLTYDEVVTPGDVRIRDIFKLYRYENLIEVFRFTGKEIRGALERSYDLLTDVEAEGSVGKVFYITFSHKNFYLGAFSPFLITAAGIEYEVDLNKPMGEKVSILRMTDGTPFDYDREYRVAVNSYIGSGGGGILTDGAGLTLKELAAKCLLITQQDIRTCIINCFKESKEPVVIPSLTNWRYVCDKETKEALSADKKLLWPDSSKRSNNEKHGRH